MKHFKYLVTFHSFWTRPEEYIVNTIEEVKELKYEGINQQYKVTIEEGDFILKKGSWFNNNTQSYI